ncbi:MAG: NfeD family protein [Oscillospiraceae bacterium]|nr:NfeD family protein [Oscillospiraceae bacterium]
MDTMIWLILLVVFLLIEAATVGMISLWFAGGALAAMITALVGGKLWLQAVIFAVVSAILLTALRPLAKRLFTPKLTPTNVDSVIGREGLVTVAIDNLSAAGTVKLGAMEWSARSTEGTPIPVGERVRVDKVEGVKVFVTPVCVGANK